MIFHFNYEELKALYRILEHEFIPYDDIEAHNTVRKIFQCIKEYESTSTESIESTETKNNLPE